MLLLNTLALHSINITSKDYLNMFIVKENMEDEPIGETVVRKRGVT